MDPLQLLEEELELQIYIKREVYTARIFPSFILKLFCEKNPTYLQIVTTDAFQNYAQAWKFTVIHLRANLYSRSWLREGLMPFMS